MAETGPPENRLRRGGRSEPGCISMPASAEPQRNKRCPAPADARSVERHCRLMRHDAYWRLGSKHMSGKLEYSTTRPVDSNIRTEILVETARLQHEREWWCESVNFLKSAKPQDKKDKLAGCTRLFFNGGYATEEGGYVRVDAGEDDLMGFPDGTFILKRLGKCSRKHGVSWRIEFEGISLGRIDNGEPSSTLKSHISRFAQMAGDDPKNRNLERRAKAILKKYVSRL